MENPYLKMTNYDIFSHKMIPRPSSFNLKCRKLINYYPKTNKFSNSTISGFYSTKNLYSNKNNNFSSSQNFNLFNIKTQTPKMKKISRIKHQSSSYKKSFPDLNNYLNKSMHSNFCLETEKLYQETYQIKKLIKQLKKQLEKISKENYKKERQLNAKENEINNIIINNDTQFDNDENNKSNTYNMGYYYNNMNINNRQNTAMNILMFKIRREIKGTLNEINKQNEKLESLKKSLFLTKSKELNIESKLYKEQIKKIEILIENGLKIREQNDNKINEFSSLKENIERQNLIIDNLTRENILLESNQEILNNKLEKLQNDVKAKIEKAKKNDNELNILSLKNKNLSKDKIIQKELYTTKKDGIPISIKSLYTSKLSSLKKNIRFYKKQIKYSEDILNKLKDQKKKLIDSNKNLEQKIKIDSNFINNTSRLKSYQRPESSLGLFKKDSPDQDIIGKLRMEYKSAREEELIWEKKANIYYDKLKEINIIYETKENEKKIEEEKKSQNQLEFGIDETNPYYTENEENIPESNIKFTSQQFNQFTYILFKNFEAKYIIGKEANNKVINPFNEFVLKNKYNKLSYPSTEFDEVIEYFTKIIMKVLNSENEYNHTLTKIFIGALLYNSECDIKKLIEYFSILFTYTKDYTNEEKILIEKMKSKYKKETKKLVECITSFILNDATSSQYFSLFKMKDLLDNNDINLKDKYIEFLFYFLKKFDDPEAKLEDLKFSLLNEIVPIGDTTVHSKAFEKNNKEEENDNDDMDNIDNIKNEEKKEEISNGDILNIEENKEINFDLDKSNKSKENDKTDKSNKSNQKKEENIFEKNKKKKKNSFDDNNSINKAKQESKKDSSTPKDECNDNGKNKDKNKEKKLNADLFDIDNENNDNFNSQNNDSSINNMAKINDIENDENKENNDSDYIKENSKDLGINNLNEQEKNGKEKEKENNKDNNEDNTINKIEQKESDNINNINNISTEKLKNEQKKSRTNSKEDNSKDKEKDKDKEQSITKKPPSIKKYEEDETGEKNISKKTKDNNENSNINNNEKNKTDIENNNNNNKDNMTDDSVTEITNEDFIKHIKDSLNIIQKGLAENDKEFINYIQNNIRKMKINEQSFEYINIEDLNDKLVDIGIILSDMQLSCLCSKYSLPEELRLIDVKKFETSLQDIKDGNFKI